MHLEITQTECQFKADNEEKNPDCEAGLQEL